MSVRAVLQFLTGRGAGRRQPLTSGALPIADSRDSAPLRIWLDLGPRGWLARTVDPQVPLRVNGRVFTQCPLTDRDIIGCGRSLFRIYLSEAAPAAAAPRRTLTLRDTPLPAMRTPGLSTVVTAPGRWGDVTATWYGESVLRLQGAADPSPELLVARLARRVNCHALIETAWAELSGIELPGRVRLVPLKDPDGQDAVLVRRLWASNAFIGVLSPMEHDVLAAALSPMAASLVIPTDVRPLFQDAEHLLVERLHAASASVLFGEPAGWELYCCPEIRPLWQRLGLPELETRPGRHYDVLDYAEGVTRLSDGGATRAADIASALASRGCLYGVVAAECAGAVPAAVRRTPISGGRGGCSQLLGPAAGAARLDVLDLLWGRGSVLGLISGRNEREVQRLAARLAFPRQSFEEVPFEGAARDRLGGFDAVLYDPADGGWAVFADPRPRPIWRQYGLPTPMLGGAA